MSAIPGSVDPREGIRKFAYGAVGCVRYAIRFFWVPARTELRAPPRLEEPIRKFTYGPMPEQESEELYWLKQDEPLLSPGRLVRSVRWWHWWNYQIRGGVYIPLRQLIRTYRRPYRTRHIY